MDTFEVMERLADFKTERGPKLLKLSTLADLLRARNVGGGSWSLAWRALSFSLLFSSFHAAVNCVRVCVYVCFLSMQL